MKAVKNILGIFILILALISLSLPIFSPNDINRDMATDLQDLILSVKNIAESANAPSEFRSEFTGAVTTLKVVAGLTTEIKAEKDHGPVNSKNIQNIQYVIPSDFLYFASFYSSPTETDSIYKSVPILIDTPPPKCFFTC